MSTQEKRIRYPRLPSDVNEELERRVREFEENHEKEVLAGGDGYVPRIRLRDYVVAAIINIAILLWWVYALFLS